MKAKTWTPQKLAKMKNINARITAALAAVAQAGEGPDRDAADARLRSLMAEFDEVAAGMPPVKMDTETGDYFPSVTADGQEVFRVKVFRMTVQDVYDVPAKNEQEAIRKALDLRDVTPVRWSLAPAYAEGISVRESR